jgi:hypothetical protein
MAKKWVELRMMADQELSIDGETGPAGPIHITEFIDGELVGGSYANYDTVSETLRGFFEKEVA